MNLNKLLTEQLNENSRDLDQLSTEQIISLMNNEDKTVASQVEHVLPKINSAVGLIVKCLRNDGRLIYVGAGTSGRIGVLDASEIPPTFGFEEERIRSVLAGGKSAMFSASEGIEDNEELGKVNLKELNITGNDVVVGITASGRTPYVMGAIRYAKEVGCPTISVSCNANSNISSLSEVSIEVVTGPEIIAGSTRLKAGTAQKMVLNMLSTVTMIRLGKVYKNFMVDLRPSNEKLISRSIAILQEVCNVGVVTAQKALDASENNVKLAIIMIEKGCSKNEAVQLLEQSKGFVRNVLEGK